jgi:hypothetical protein
LPSIIAGHPAKQLRRLRLAECLVRSRANSRQFGAIVRSDRNQARFPQIDLFARTGDGNPEQVLHAFLPRIQRLGNTDGFGYVPGEHGSE